MAFLQAKELGAGAVDAGDRRGDLREAAEASVLMLEPFVENEHLVDLASPLANEPSAGFERYRP